MCQIPAEKVGRDAAGTTFADEMQSNLPDNMGKQRRCHKQAVCWNSSFKGNMS